MFCSRCGWEITTEEYAEWDAPTRAEFNSLGWCLECQEVFHFGLEVDTGWVDENFSENVEVRGPYDDDNN